MAKMDRAVGYCQNIKCDLYCNGHFLLNHGESFYCAKCRHLGSIQPEKFIWENKGSITREVRVEFDYCPTRKRYQQIAVVTDDEMREGSTLTFQSPLIKTEKRALKMAESTLGRLALGHSIEHGASTGETIIDFDEERAIIKQACNKFEQEVMTSAFWRYKK